MEKTFDVEKSIQAQKDYVQKTGSPFFAPSDGKCWNCREQIYAQMRHYHGSTVYHSGIDLERASTSLTTGCPHCHRSYCE